MNYYLIDSHVNRNYRYIIQANDHEEAYKANKRAYGAAGVTIQKIDGDTKISDLLPSVGSYAKREGIGCMQSLSNKSITIKQCLSEPINIWLEDRACNKILLEK